MNKFLFMKWNVSYIYLVDWTSVFSLISSPGNWQTWFHSRKRCIDVIWPNFCYLADDDAPILNCPNISSTTDEGLNSSSTVLLSSTVTDNVDFDLDVNCSHSSQDIFLIGDTTVNCSSSDAAGNTEYLYSRSHSNRCEFVSSLCLKVPFPGRVLDYGIFNLCWKGDSFWVMCSTN